MTKKEPNKIWFWLHKIGIHDWEEPDPDDRMHHFMLRCAVCGDWRNKTDSEVAL